MLNSNVFEATKRCFQVFHKHDLSSSEQEKTNITSHPPHILIKMFTKRTHGIFRQSVSLIQFVVLSVRLFVYLSVLARFIVIA